MSKKKLKVMEAEREHFVHGCKEPGKECAGCVANGVPENIANEIYDDMISFASYAFNKSHAACYAYVAFQTAYLKCHYPHEFMAALLTSVLDNTSKVIEYTTECQRLGIKVQQPDINVSRGGFTADGERIRFGLNAVKSVGRDLIEAVIKERAERPIAASMTSASGCTARVSTAARWRTSSKPVHSILWSRPATVCSRVSKGF